MYPLVVLFDLRTCHGDPIDFILSGVEHKKLVGLAEKHFGGLDAEPKNKDELRNVPYCRFTGSDVS